MRRSLLSISLAFFSIVKTIGASSPEVVEEVVELASPPTLLVEEETASIPLIEAAPPIASARDDILQIAPKEGYTINYNTLSIIEYIRFASKICSVNFIFDEIDLNFNVTVVSEGPITAKNVMATLVQLLRIHGLSLIEQDNNLVIHKNADVKQIAKLVTDQKGAGDAPIITRIFRLKTVKPDSVAAIIRPMISKESILDVSLDTKQIILTDITANVDKVALLIENLDMPYANIETQTYETKHNSAEYLIGLATQIMDPIVRGSPFIMVPQPLARKVYIVSTVELNHKALAVLRQLDVPPKKGAFAARSFKADNIYVYKVEKAAAESVMRGLHEIAKNLQKAGVTDYDLLEALHSAKLIQETNSILFVASKESIEKLKEFLPALDISSQVMDGLGSSFFIFKPQNRGPKEIQIAIHEMAKNLKGTKGVDPALIETMENAKVNPLTNTLFFSGEEHTFSRVKDLLLTIDTPGGSSSRAVGQQQFFIYQILQAQPHAIQASLKHFAEDLKKSHVDADGIIEVIEKMRYVKESHSLLFTGPDAALKRLQEIVPALDKAIEPAAPISSQFFVYKPRHQTGEHLISSLKDMERDLHLGHLADPGLLRSLQSSKWVSSTHSLLFTGDPSSLKKIEELLATLDVSPAASQRSGYFVYKLTNTTTSVLEESIKTLVHNLKHSKSADPNLLHMLESIRYIPGSNSLLLSGNLDTIEEAKMLIASYDSATQETSGVNFVLYKLLYANPQKTEKYIEELAANLTKDGANLDLIKALKSGKWMQDSYSFLFSGPDAALTKVKEILSTYDLSSQAQVIPGYFLYRLQNTTGDLVEEDLEGLAKNLKQSGLVDSKLIQVIDTMRYVKETNSILLTGDAKAIEEAKELLAKYDYPRPTAAVPALNQFFLYKPQFLDAAGVQKALFDIGESLKQSQLADPSFLATIASMKYVPSTNSIIFTGTEEALQKIQTLIKDVDVASSQRAIQHLGKMSFFLYRLMCAPQEQVVGAITKIAADLKKSGTSDKEFLDALASMKYIVETNSLLFTGHEEALAKVQKLVEKFDVPGVSNIDGQTGGNCCPGGPTQYFLYAVQYLPGPDLIKLLQDFVEGVRSSGLCDPELFQSINSARWVEKTRSLIFTGTDKSLEQLKELLKTLDIAANLPRGETSTSENPIQGIDNTGFLVYKLQFHKGDEIQGALRQIAKDLTISNAPVNQNLLNAINSVQWLEVTNSLLCSGDEETLARLRDLIKSLDIPLKQVFIEMLVIETSLANSLSFGLEWGGKYKYRDKFSGSMNNSIPSTATPPVLDTFSQNLAGLAAPATPNPQLIPFNPSGFDLGIIGEVIRHNGQTYLTLGSLLNALQQDTETTIVMNPKIITQDSKTSSIFVGQNVPFAGSFVSNTNANTVSTSNIEYRDIGMNLTVTPVLGNSDIVTLEIAFDQSSVISGTQNQIAVTSGTTTTLEGITTSKTTMETTVHVPNDNFLILSGQVTTTQSKTSSGLPCLGGLPVVGALFSTETTSSSNGNIVIFLRPHILNSLEDMKKISQAQEDIFREQSGTPFLEQTFDEGMELIKTIDDE